MSLNNVALMDAAGGCATRWDPAKAKAEYRNGLLTVTVPTVPEAPAKLSATVLSITCDADSPPAHPSDGQTDENAYAQGQSDGFERFALHAIGSFVSQVCRVLDAALSCLGHSPGSANTVVDGSVAGLFKSRASCDMCAA